MHSRLARATYRNSHGGRYFPVESSESFQDSAFSEVSVEGVAVVSPNPPVCDGQRRIGSEAAEGQSAAARPHRDGEGDVGVSDRLP